MPGNSKIRDSACRAADSARRPSGGPTGTTRRSPHLRFGVCEGPLVLGRGRSAIRCPVISHRKEANGSTLRVTGSRSATDPRYRAVHAHPNRGRSHRCRWCAILTRKGRILLADPKGEECLATPRSGTRLAERRAVAAPPGGPTGTTRRSPHPRFRVCKGPRRAWPSRFASCCSVISHRKEQTGSTLSVTGSCSTTDPWIEPRPRARTEEAGAEVVRALSLYLRVASY